MTTIALSPRFLISVSTIMPTAATSLTVRACADMSMHKDHFSKALAQLK
jgi:hypothetical protein